MLCFLEVRQALFFAPGLPHVVGSLSQQRKTFCGPGYDPDLVHLEPMLFKSEERVRRSEAAHSKGTPTATDTPTARPLLLCAGDVQTQILKIVQQTY